MRLSAVALVVAVAACGTARSTTGRLAAERVPGQMFERVATALRRFYYDTVYRRTELPTLIDEFRPAAMHALDEVAERDVIWRLLERIPASHLALLSRGSYAALWDELRGRPHVTLGMQLAQVDGRYFASAILTGGPADSARIRAWDEIVAVDQTPTGQSPRLDWRADDAHLGDERDPPTYRVVVADGDSVLLTVADAPGRTRVVRVTARPYSAMLASRESVRLMEQAGVRIGYVHWWYMQMDGVPESLNRALKGPLHPSEALILDLRGRGGSGEAVRQIVNLLAPGPGQRFAGPVVALVDRQTRSAKEMLAYELRARGVARLVGEPTAGAVVGMGFVEVGDGVLALPFSLVPPHTARLELQPIQPDVVAAWGGPYSGARDPILEAGLDEAVRLVRAR
jgi:carboxyl-terminal processing protease